MDLKALPGGRTACENWSREAWPAGEDQQTVWLLKLHGQDRRWEGAGKGANDNQLTWV